jgi:methylated-DNA-[protein]-cysteine S-methyltransferase
MNFTKLYHSPLGILEISSDEDAITNLVFREATKKVSPPINETNENSKIIEECMRQLNDYFEGKRKDFDIKTNPKGTNFQKIVWENLQNIAFGKTLSYLELSRKIGNEKAIRAVGTANGNNPIGIIIPCHRVIGTDGSLVGYAGDLWRKEWLLRHEGSLPKQNQLNLFTK